MTYADYAAIPAINATAIKAGRTSMLHMRHSLTGPEREETPALRLGRLVHAAILEPDVLLPTLAVYDGNKQGNKWRDYQAANAGREIVTRAEAAAIGAISATVHGNERAAWLLSRTRHEAVLTWTGDKYGAAKARLDGLAADAIVEVKTTRAQTERQFAGQFCGLGYDLQVGWYAEGVCRTTGAQHSPPCWLIVVSSVAPYWCQVVRCADQDVERWRGAAVEIAAQYRECESAGKFDGPLAGVDVLVEPAWAKGDNGEVDISGGEMGDAAEL